jgi:carboxypeptidase family protein
MKPMKPTYSWCVFLTLIVTMGCSPASQKAPPVAAQPEQRAVPVFHVDPQTAGSVSGTVRFTGKRPRPGPIDMSEDPACIEAHRGKPVDESTLVSSKSALANVFVYVKKGLEGKNFGVPSTPVTIDQNGCWFQPRVLGIQTNQMLRVTNSDPVTHNIHPMGQINREWNHSQGAGDEPLARKFIKPEIMIPVKCNIHHWMRAYIGVVDHPYFAVSKPDGSFTIEGLPPGTYTLEFWHESLGTQEREITIPPHERAVINVTFKGN